MRENTKAVKCSLKMTAFNVILKGYVMVSKLFAGLFHNFLLFIFTFLLVFLIDKIGKILESQNITGVFNVMHNFAPKHDATTNMTSS